MRREIAEILAAQPHRQPVLSAAAISPQRQSLPAPSWLPHYMAARAAATGSRKRQRRQCILLWMSGGPSQLDTFDLKPGHANGGEFQEIDTAVPGLRISEHLPRLAKQAGQLAILRGLSTKEGDHGRGTYLMRTGHVPGGPVRYPAIGASLAKELGGDESELPQYISVAPYQQFNQAAFGAGFLGPRYAPAVVESRARGRSFDRRTTSNTAADEAHAQRKRIRRPAIRKSAAGRCRGLGARDRSHGLVARVREGGFLAFRAPRGRGERRA